MGVTWKLPLSVFSTLVATSRSEYPPCRGFGAIDVDAAAWDSRTAAGIRRSTRPGTCRSCASSLSATCLLASTSLPSICTSIGAGKPKFRICVVMSAGRK